MNAPAFRLVSAAPGRLAVTAGLLIAALVALHALESSGFGPLSRHMGAHLILMNVLAPLMALAWCNRRGDHTRPGLWLAAATAAQMAALWAVHAPGALAAVSHSPAGHLPVQIFLFALALWFWIAVIGQTGAARWRALVALLLTGKLACLLGVLLVFAPRELYAGFATLEDQQRAGLWMIAACPLTYVAGALAIAVLWLDELGLRSRAARRPA